METLQTFIQKWFQTSDFTLEKTNKGISNQNFFLTLKNQHYFVRVPKSGHDKLLIGFQKEKQILPMIADLDVETVLFDSQSGIKITKFVPNALEYHETENPYKNQKVGQLLRRLHTKTRHVPFLFEPFKKINHYRSSLTMKPIVQFENEEDILTRVAKLYTPDTLCHNDLVQGNILFAPKKEYLIDWEYGAMNDRRFDIASFFSENQITDPRQRAQFFKGYDMNVSEQEILLFEAMEDILWGYWANLLYEQRHESIYKDIALDKVKHYHDFAIH